MKSESGRLVPARFGFRAPDEATAEVARSYFHMLRNFRYSEEELISIAEAARGLGVHHDKVGEFVTSVTFAVGIAIHDMSMKRDSSMETALAYQQRLQGISNKGLSLMEELAKLDLNDEWRCLTFDHGRSNGEFLLGQKKFNLLFDGLEALVVAARREGIAAVAQQKTNKSGHMAHIDKFMFQVLDAASDTGASQIGKSENGPAHRLMSAVYEPVRRELLKLPDAPKQRLRGLEGATAKGVLARWHGRVKNSELVQEILP